MTINTKKIENNTSKNWMNCFLFIANSKMAPSTPIHYIVPKEDQYTFAGLKLFKFDYTIQNRNVTFRDILVDLDRNIRPTLLILAKKIQLKNVSKMKKSELAEALRTYIQFE